jgi:shikimate dehydrogenase
MILTEKRNSPPRAGVIGWPVAHSRSPLIHGHWLKVHNLAGSYERIPVPPEEIDAFLRAFPDSGLSGANVTVPHKEAAYAAADDIDDVGRAIGAVNTLWMEHGKLRATNTDGIGFLANLDDCAKGWDKNPGIALVLGAGGAARAVVWGLMQRGFAVRIANRTRERAQALADRFGGDTAAHDLTEAARLLSDCWLVVNTTSLGMTGKDELPLGLDRLRPDAVVTDIVYVPLETALLAEARARGNRTVDGLGMLLHQAVPGFERWFGVRPTVTPALRSLILADLGVLG